MRLPQLGPVLAVTAIFITSSFSLQQRAVPPAGVIPGPRKFQQSDQRPKYFQEPGWDENLVHYDIRYYTGAPVSYDKRADTLYDLIRAFLTTAREKNIETWIAHGTLLGWWWNGKMLPWDWDLDVQVSVSTLNWMGDHLNMTIHNYTSVSIDENGNEIEVVRQYLLDVNSNIDERTRGNGENVIDARFIDTSTGLFIDITGLAETNPQQGPGIWSCKNNHRYLTKDIYPLRETIFEGVPALIPYAFHKVLTAEYSSRALTKTMYEGYVLLF